MFVSTGTIGTGVQGISSAIGSWLIKVFNKELTKIIKCLQSNLGVSVFNDIDAHELRILA